MGITDCLYDPISCVTGGAGTIAGSIASSAADVVLNSIADMVTKALNAVEMEMASWTLMSSPQVGCANDPGLRFVPFAQAAGACPSSAIQAWMTPLTLIVALVGIFWQAGKMMLTRRGEPAVRILKGLVSIVLWSGISITAVNLALNVSNSFADWVIHQSLGVSADSLVKGAIATGSAQMSTGIVVGLVIIVGILDIFALIVQIILMVFRTAALTILTGVIPFAATGQLTGATSQWLTKILGWTASLIFYKDAAALCYAVTFLMVKDSGDSLMQWLAGLAMSILACIALPVLMKFFTWVFGHTSGGSGLNTAAAAAAMGVNAMAMRQSRTDEANDYSDYLNRGNDGPPPGGGPGGGGPPPPPPPPPSDDDDDNNNDDPPPPTRSTSSMPSFIGNGGPRGAGQGDGTGEGANATQATSTAADAVAPGAGQLIQAGQQAKDKILDLANDGTDDDSDDDSKDDS